MDSCFHLLLLLLAAASLVKGEDTLQDFVEVNYNFTFIYHDFQRLLLMIHESKCYYHKIDDPARKELTDVLTGRILYQTEMIGMVLRKSSTVQRSSLSTVRDLYGDRLADFHCLGKDIYNIPANDHHHAAIHTHVHTTDSTATYHLPHSTAHHPQHTTASTHHAQQTGTHIHKPHMTSTASSTQTVTPMQNIHQCQDGLGHGFSCSSFAQDCDSNVYVKLLCQGHCNRRKCNGTPTVSPPVTSASSGHCEDHVVGQLRCSELAHICKDPVGQTFCPKHCGLCATTTPTTVKTIPVIATTHKPSSTPSPTTHTPKPTHHTPNPTTPSPTTPTPKPSTLKPTTPKPTVPTSQPTTAHTPKPTTTALPTRSSTPDVAVFVPEVCKDHLDNGWCSKLNVSYNTCQPDNFDTCLDFCGVCDCAKGTFGLGCKPCSSSCVDQCDQIYGFCTCKPGSADPHCFQNCPDGTYGVNCKYKCSAGCQGGTCDKRTGGCTCLPGYEGAWCNITCTQRHPTNCEDLAPRHICEMNAVCSDELAKVRCKKTCGMCDGCVDEIEVSSHGKRHCSDLYGNNGIMDSLDKLCADPIGKQVCAKTCKCPGFCKQ